MKLRFVKFFTSRGNEIEKKEEEALPSRAPLSPSQAAARTPLPRSRPSHIIPLFLHPAHQPTSSRRPAHPPPRVGRAIFSSYPLSSCFASPFLLHKLLKRQSVEGRTVAGAQLADPAVLPNDNTAGAQLARRPMPLHPIGQPATFLRFQWQPLCGGWSHRKTKYENELSCFITFIDE